MFAVSTEAFSSSLAHLFAGSEKQNVRNSWVSCRQTAEQEHHSQVRCKKRKKKTEKEKRPVFLFWSMKTNKKKNSRTGELLYLGVRNVPHFRLDIFSFRSTLCLKEGGEKKRTRVENKTKIVLLLNNHAIVSKSGQKINRAEGLA